MCGCILARAPKALGIIGPSRSVIKTREDSPCSSKKRFVSSLPERERKLLRPLKVRSLASPALSSDALSKRTHSAVLWFSGLSYPASDVTSQIPLKSAQCGALSIGEKLEMRQIQQG